jgi:hypothetical protein
MLAIGVFNMEGNTWEEMYEIMGVSVSNDFKPIRKNYVTTTLQNWV